MIIALIIETITAYCGILVIGAMNHEAALLVPCALWLLLVLIESLLERRFLQREHTMTALYVINGFFALINIFVLLHFATGAVGVGDWIIIGGVSMIVSVRIVVVQISPFKDRQMLIHFELAFVQALMYLVLLDTGYELSMEGTLCVLAAPVFGFLSLTAMRGGRDGIKSPAVWLMGGLLGVLVAVSTVLNQSVATVSQGAAKAGMGVVDFVGGIIYSMALFLASLVKDPGGEIQADEIVEAVGKTGTNSSSGVDFGPYMRMALAVAALVVVVVLLIVLIRGLKKRSRVYVNDGSYVNHNGNIGRSRQGLFEQLAFAVKYEIFYWKNKDNALGVYLWIDKWMKKEHLKQSESSFQTIRSQLLAAGQHSESETVCQLLEQVGTQLDEYFYNGQKKETLFFAEAKELRSIIMQRW